jgi:hypothetical protein
MSGEYYFGWTIMLGSGSQKFVAVRNGVTMRAHNMETLREMIRQRATLKASDIMPGEAKDWGLI